MELRNDQDRVEGLPKCTLPEFIAGEALLITPSKFASLFFSISGTLMSSFERFSQSQDHPLHSFNASFDGGFAEAQTIGSQDKDSNSAYHVGTLDSGGSSKRVLDPSVAKSPGQHHSISENLVRALHTTSTW